MIGDQGKVIGVDFSRKMLDVACKKITRQGTKILNCTAQMQQHL